jgi:hypothetical protein
MQSEISGATDRSRTNERRLRLVAACILLYVQFQGLFGLQWDIQWHTSVGRDRFLTPPHLLLYTGVALSGLVCLAMVLLETIRYRRGRGVDDGNSIGVFRVFHAPLGFVLAGFGNLVLLTAAPLDNYWHQLYGIDVELWAPFHMMGMIGGIIAGLGTIYIWASLKVEKREAQGRLPRLGMETWGALLAVTFLITHLLILAQPALVQSPTFSLGPVRIMTYPLLLALLIPWLFIAAIGVAGWPGAATLVALLLVAFNIFVQLFVPWAVTSAAHAQGLAFRSASLAPHFNVRSLEFNLCLLGVAIVLDLLVWRVYESRSHKHLTLIHSAALVAIPLWAIAVAFARGATRSLASVQFPPGVHFGAPADWTATFLALPVAMLAGALSGYIGHGLAQVLQRNPR